LLRNAPDIAPHIQPAGRTTPATQGIRASCDPKDVVYPHKKPALVLTAVFK
jgi:hypothetical protein